MCTPRASASTSSGWAYSRSIRSRTWRSSRRSRSRCCSAGVVTPQIVPCPTRHPGCDESYLRSRSVLLQDETEGGTAMWDTVETTQTHLLRDLLCPRCGHAVHTFLACGDDCA